MSAMSIVTRSVMAIVIAVGSLVGGAAAPASAEGSLTRHTYTNAAGSREYLLYTPSQAGPVPLIVFLHGCGAPPLLPGMNELAEARGFAVAYPIQSLPGGCWQWQVPEHQRRDAGEPSLIAGITRQVMSERAIDPRRVYLAGHSAGSGMTANLSAAYPDLYAAAGLVAGCGFLTCRDITGLSAYRMMGPRARPVPAYIVWGTADSANSYVTGRLQLLQWLGMNDLADDGLPNLSVPRLPTSIASVPAAGGAPAFTIERHRDRRGCGQVDFATGFGMGHIPDFRWQPVLPAMVDFLLANPLRVDC